MNDDDDAWTWTSQGHARGGPIACARAKASVVDFDACGASARSPAISNRHCEHGLRARIGGIESIHSFIQSWCCATSVRAVVAV